LIVSGGHTDLALMTGHAEFQLVGRTRDDAAGEAFDKAARVLGLAYPGGPEIQRVAMAATGTEEPFTRPRVKGSNDFSYSGLKTAVLRRARERGVAAVDGASEPEQGRRADRDRPDPERAISEIAAAFQDAVVDSLVGRTLTAADDFGARGIVVCGGVAANAALRAEMTDRASIPVLMPRPALCTDNAAMVAASGYYSLVRLGPGQSPGQEWDMDVIPGLAVGESGRRPG